VTTATTSEFAAWSHANLQRIEETLQRLLPAPDIAPQRLHQAMRYAVLEGGKRVRPLLAFAAGELADADPGRVAIAGAAVELIHAYSLVHDDLPCMDNDELRRGKPTCHVEFDEATALLVGDALQSLAFQVISDYRLADDVKTQLEMVKLLASAAGSRGMAGGQAIDLESVAKALTVPELEFMHIHKTGALIRASALLGALCGNSTSSRSSSASLSRSWTTYSTPTRPPPLWARPRARMPRTISPPMSAQSGFPARGRWPSKCGRMPSTPLRASGSGRCGCGNWRILLCCASSNCC
jgi:geranylgeranyl pyrophosphate synthase